MRIRRFFRTEPSELEPKRAQANKTERLTEFEKNCHFWDFFERFFKFFWMLKLKDRLKPHHFGKYSEFLVLNPRILQKIRTIYPFLGDGNLALVSIWLKSLKISFPYFKSYRRSNILVEIWSCFWNSLKSVQNSCWSVRGRNRMRSFTRSETWASLGMRDPKSRRIRKNGGERGLI